MEALELDAFILLRYRGGEADRVSLRAELDLCQVCFGEGVLRLLEQGMNVTPEHLFDLFGRGSSGDDDGLLEASEEPENCSGGRECLTARVAGFYRSL